MRIIITLHHNLERIKLYMRTSISQNRVTLYVSKVCLNGRNMFDKSNKQNDNHVQRNNKSQSDTNKVYTKDKSVVTNVNSRNVQTRQTIDQLILIL